MLGGNDGTLFYNSRHERTSGSSGSGNGAVNYTGAENTTGKQRTGKINVVTSDKKSKKIFTVVQKKK